MKLIEERKVGIIGFGHLGSALFEGWTAAGYGVLVNNGTLERTRGKLGDADIDDSAGCSLKQLAHECKILALTIRGNVLADVAAELDRSVGQEHIVLSFLAQESRESVYRLLRQSQAEVCKGMTTLGVRKRQGVSAVQFDESASYGNTDTVTRLLHSVGSVRCLDSEDHMQAFTVTVGCFPGALAYMLEQWAYAGEQHGITLGGDDVQVLVQSSADLLQAYGSANALRCAVATKGGVTERVVEEMGKKGLGRIVSDGVNAGKAKMEKKA